MAALLDKHLPPGVVMCNGSRVPGGRPALANAQVCITLIVPLCLLLLLLLLLLFFIIFLGVVVMVTVMLLLLMLLLLKRVLRRFLLRSWHQAPFPAVQTRFCHSAKGGWYSDGSIYRGFLDAFLVPPVVVCK